LQIAKDWLIVSHNDDDALITQLLTAIRMHVEAITKLCLIPKTITLIAELYGSMKFPRTPMETIVEVLIKENGAYVLLATDQYELDAGMLTSKRIGRHKIVYDAGYSATAEAGPVPEDIILAMKEEIAYRYDHRGDKQRSPELQPLSKKLLASYINYAYA
jgi:uncharacterized phiE125 gp8 family phage protein